MQKKYRLEGLDCPNCALKIEKALNKHEKVESASVNAATLKCHIDYSDYNEEIENEVIQLIKNIEEVEVIKLDKTHHHEHECECGHDHEEHEHHHEHECGCGHHHEEHEHHHEQECGCGHHHEEHEHHHEHECGCGHHHEEHEHHHEHECECGHHHEEHEHHHEHECGCGHHHEEHEHHHEHECGCGHHHEEHEHHHEHECGCGHDHEEHEHHHEHECGCGHDHEEHEHHHEQECGCGHHHEHIERKERKQASLDSIKVKWQLEGLDCANCALKVEDAVNELEEVDSATLNFTTKTLIFYIKKNENKQEVIKKVKKAILETEEVEIIEENQEITQKKDYKYVILNGGVVLFVIGLFLTNNLLIITSYFLIGFSVIKKAIKNIKRGEVFDENFLMLIATIGALIVGEYLEAVAVMLFYQVGEYFQNKAVDKSRKSIADLMNIKVDIAHVVRNGKIVDVSPEEVKVNDVIVIQPGERVALDGIIQKGISSLDTSALTGESLPKEVAENEEVLAGCINLNGVLEVKVIKELSESTVSRILDLVENASSKKAKTELKMTRFARVYTPIVVVSALLLAIVPNFFNTGVGWQEWLIRACTFLVISCPCALVLSIPLGYFAGIGSASKKGILVKGGNYLEILSEVDTIVFDKTGTLTNGNFKVTNIYSENKEKCLELAAMAESFSTHPIGNSIVEEYGKEIDKNKVIDVEEIAGQGIKCNINKNTVLVGNIKLMANNNIEVQEIDSIGTIVYVASNNELIGMIEISDTIKETTKEALKELKNKGISRLVMLTGDRKKTAEQIALDCGLDEVKAELLPTDKVNEFEKILATSTKKVAYVGDGINDAPVLARSDIGIAMGGLGSEAAVEASDIVLMKDDFSVLPKGIELAKATQKIMNQNIAFILIVKLSILGLGLFGYEYVDGVFADVGVSVLAVLNSMRILRK